MKEFKIIVLFFLVTFQQYGQTEKKIYQFGFEENTDSEVIPISHTDETIDQNRLYGFDFQTAKNAKFEEDAFTSTSPVYFSVELPEGNYKVKVVLGSKNVTSETTIKAESRRVMAQQVPVGKGESHTETFLVNLRSTKINEKDKVNLKSRELNELNWDNKLTLEFSGSPAVKSITIVPVKNFRTLYLAGDSTVTDQDVEPWASWGQMIPQFFDQEIVVANYAASGESLVSFKSRNRFAKILSQIQPGDYVFIEFGHNDEKIKGEGNGAYGLYSNLLREYVIAAREKGAIPVLLTPTQRRSFSSDGELKDTHGDFPDAMRKVAVELNVPIFDLTEITTKMYESWGAENSKFALVHYPANTFPGQYQELSDNTHFNTFGANEIALAIVEEIKNSSLGLKRHLKKGIPHYNPMQPNDIKEWTLPMSPRFQSTKPEGN